MRRLWTLRKGKRGQAIVVGSVGLFMMALGVIATLNIGHAVSERIRLQNAADAAAYSLAAEEARLFNFFAFTNRAQVGHYSAAMTVHSYISYLTYVGGIYGSLRDLYWDAASIYQCICDLDIPYVSYYYCIIAEIVSLIGNGYAFVVELTETTLTVADELAAQLVEAMHLLNRGIWRAQVQQGLMINLLLTSGGYAFVEANDPAVDFGLVNGFNALFNQLEFNQVFDRGAGANFSLLSLAQNMSDITSPRIHDPDNTEEDVETARRVMTEIANGARWGPGTAGSEETFVTDRTQTPPPLRDDLGFARFGVLAALQAEHRGQTRMVSPEDGGPGPIEMGLPIEEIRADEGDDGTYYTGSIIASDDYLEPSDAFGVFSLTNIFYANESEHVGAALVSDNDSGGHYGYNYGNQTTWSSGTMRLPPDVDQLVATNPLELICASSCCSTVDETFPSDFDEDYDEHEGDIHDWQGVAAYPKFNPNPDETADYNQPSTWMFLNLPPENFNRFGTESQQPWSFDFRLTLGNRTVGLDTAPGRGDSALLPFLEGLNVLSRGQAYYHRPRPQGDDEESNWQEHPNFFNPFWRARLAPIGMKLTQLYNRHVSRNMHAGADANPVLAGGVNLVRNMLGDVFFHTVTSVITH